MADEQRFPTVITVEAGPQSLSGDALRQEIERLQLLAAAEEAQIKAELEAQKPPRPIDEILMDFVSNVCALLGNHPSLDELNREFRRASGK